MQVIILAGGLGTRLKGHLDGLPKSMADINGRPFLEYLFQYISSFDVTKIVLAVGYRRAAIESHFGRQYQGVEIEYSVELKPLGTGGAIKQALKCISDEQAVVINGDTLTEIDLDAMLDYHRRKSTMLTIGVVKLQESERYGSVEIQADGRLSSFGGSKSTGFINSGVYIVCKHLFDQVQVPLKFSFEEAVLKSRVHILPMYAYVQDCSFIDIGVPEDLKMFRDDRLA